MLSSTFSRALRNLVAALACINLAGTSLAQTSTTAAPQTRVWNNPAMDYAEWRRNIRVARVEFTPEATRVSFHFWYPPTSDMNFSKDIHLLASGRQFAAIGSEGTALGEWFKMPMSGNVDFTVLFEPLPDAVESFDVEFPGFGNLPNIHSREPFSAASEGPVESLANTYWRNHATGDWLIGFAPDAIIYDSQVWKIESQSVKKDAFDFVVSNGQLQQRILVGKAKKGQRSITIGRQKAIQCDQITSRFLPDYPVADTRTQFANNHYCQIDTFTIIGWYRNMSEAVWDADRSFSSDGMAKVRPESSDVSAPIDSLGRFTLRMPLENTHELYADWSRSGLKLVAEPGDTIFLLQDFATDQVLVMGRNARVQNEIIANDRIIYIPCAYSYYQTLSFEKFMAMFDSVSQHVYTYIDTIAARSPNISGRYRTYRRLSTLSEVARSTATAMHYYINNMDEMMAYAKTNVLDRIDDDFTLSDRTDCYFLETYAGMLERKFDKGNLDLVPAMDIMRKEQLGGLTEADWALVDQYNKEVAEIVAKLDSLTDMEEKQKAADAFNSSPIVTQMNDLLNSESVKTALAEIVERKTIPLMLQLLDSLGWTQLQRDIYLGKKLCEMLDYERKPLSDFNVELAKSEIKTQIFLNDVLALNERYAQLSRKTLEGGSLYDIGNDSLLSDGAQILRKILEPMRGKIVLLDIWGTWCGPCKEALSHSQEEYERLKPYGISYLYLANNSPQESWENVIKEYDVQGPDVYHYNLPSAQQSAIEHMLGVNSFPSYFLIDQSGQMLDINVDPRNLGALEDILKRLTQE